eukprot:3025885-Rhodomonas_salina.2
MQIPLATVAGYCAAAQIQLKEQLTGTKKRSRSWEIPGTLARDSRKPSRKKTEFRTTRWMAPVCGVLPHCTNFAPYPGTRVGCCRVLLD